MGGLAQAAISQNVKFIAEYAAGAVEVLGVAIIAFWAVYSLAYGAQLLLQRSGGEDALRRCRQQLARGILLGLEFLVAADIIHTVAIDLSLKSVAVLAIIVAIRTFLSFSLEVEISGRWPWQQEKEAA